VSRELPLKEIVLINAAPGYLQGGLRGMTNLSEGNQELLVVKRQSWKTPGELR